MNEGVLLNVADTMSRSRANGPGVRAVIWVQGCTIGCPGCYNAFTHPHKSAKLMQPAEIAKWVDTISDIEGITFSGGEPFEQAAAIIATIDEIRLLCDPKFSVFAFSGFEYDSLIESEDPVVQELLKRLDILSAGPYISKLRDTNLLWRGSSNQTLQYLSERYSSREEEKWTKESPVEEFTLDNNSMHFTGFEGPGSAILKSALKQLNQTHH
jgi:anaerobic ribonucleoside-triphosphate reductase activating protein